MERPSFERRLIARFVDVLLLSFTHIVLDFDYYIVTEMIYFFTLQFLFKSTIGDWMFGIKIYSKNKNQRLSWYQLILRIILMYIYTPFCWLEFLKQKQAFHDKLCKTDVKKVRRKL